MTADEVEYRVITWLDWFSLYPPLAMLTVCNFLLSSAALYKSHSFRFSLENGQAVAAPSLFLRSL